LSKLTGDQLTAKDHAGDPITIGGRAPAREDISDALGGKLDALPRDVRDTRRVPLGTYRGLRFGIVLHPQFPPSVYLEGAVARQSSLSREHQGPRAVLNALERLAGGYDSECDRIRQDLAIAEAQLRDYQARLGKAFVHERYLAELTGLRDQLKSRLSATARESGEAERPSVSELAERIKTLKAAHTVEAAPQRVRQKQSTAEEPVTARIRRRTETRPTSDNIIGADAPVPTQLQPPSTQHPSAQPTTFRERLRIEWRDDAPPRTI
jgi:hypothetical protein